MFSLLPRILTMMHLRIMLYM